MVENSGLQSAHKKNAFGPPVATYGITEHPKSIGVVTLVRGTYDLNLKKMGQNFWGVECTQEISVVVGSNDDKCIVSLTFVQGYNYSDKNQCL